MRRPLLLVGVSGILLLCLAGAGGARQSRSGAVRGGAGRVLPGRHTRRITLRAPAPSDLSLELIDIPAPPQNAGGRRWLKLTASEPLGADYIAAARVDIPVPGTSRAAALPVLVLIVNRPTGLDDPTALNLTLSAHDLLGVPSVHSAIDPFTRASTGSTPRLCGLLGSRGAPTAGELQVLLSRGSPLSQLSSSSALIDAYEVVCGLHYPASFKRDVRGESTGISPPVAEPSPPAPEPAPLPEPPHCIPCDPAPGYACPLIAQPNLCIARSAGRRAGAGSH